MKNITLNIVGQRVLAEILKEKEDIIKMNILSFENLEDYLKGVKGNITKNAKPENKSNCNCVSVCETVYGS